MSTFSGLNTAYTGLNAARTGLNTVGQNITNATTVGYTRQRVETTALGAPARGSLNDLGTKTGQGVSVTGISRLGDAFLDARVRTTFSAAGYSSVRADALSSIETTLAEPGDNGMSSQLQGFWSAWQDVANQPGEPASSAVLLQKSTTLAQRLSAGYTALDNQWTQTRTKAAGITDEINSTAAQVGALNGAIRAAGGSGSSTNELVDQRDRLTGRIAQLAGGTVNSMPDGTNEILIGGNVLVSGSQVNTVAIAGPTSMSANAPVTLEWTRRPGTSVDLDGGQLAGALSVLAPAVPGKNGSGQGGAIAEAAAGYNALAVQLAATVNAAHQTGATPTGATNLDFFAFKPGVAAAAGLTVLPTGPDGIAAAAVGAGGKDGSAADAISQLGQGPGSPDAFWSTFVIHTGTSSKAALAQSATADAASTNAVGLQLANASVDLDEENVNLLSYQHAYQAAARVMTAIDESLDVLINQTGKVGR